MSEEQPVPKTVRSKRRRRDLGKEHRHALEILGGIAVSLALVLIFLSRTSMIGCRHLQDGISAARNGNAARAIEELTQCVNTGGAPLSAYEYRALAYSEQGDHGLAAADYSRVIAAEPNNVEALLGRACQYLENKDFYKACIDFDKILQLKPTMVEALRLRAAAEWKLKRYKAVTDDCQAYLACYRTEPVDHQITVLLLLASALKELEQPDEAIRYCRQAIALNANDPRALEKRAGILKEMHKLPEAIADCTAALKIAPSVDLLRLRARCCIEQNQFAPAMKDLSEAIKLMPNDLNARNERAQLALSTRDYQLALADSKFTLDAAPTNREANQIFARARKLTGADKIKVISTDNLTHETTTRSDLQFEGADRSGATFRGYTLLVAGKDAEAASVLSAQVKAHPDELAARKYLAHALLSCGHSGDALKQFESVSSARSLSAEDGLAMAQAASDCGDTAKSISWYQKYLSIRPEDNKARLALIEAYQHAGDTTNVQKTARDGLHYSHGPQEKGIFARILVQQGGSTN